MSLHPSWRLGAVAVLAAAIGGISAGIAGTAIGQPAAGQSRPTVVAVVSISKILSSLREREVKEADLAQMGKQRESVVNALGQKAQAAMQELEVLKAGTDDWKAKREEALRFEGQFRLETEIAQRTLAEQQKLMQLALFNKITAAVKAYAEREGIDLVVTNDSGVEIPEDLSEQQFLAAVTGRRVVFAADAIDITEEVALAMNNEFKAP